jgi:DNA-binding MarR family transcriptional regulator
MTNSSYLNFLESSKRIWLGVSSNGKAILEMVMRSMDKPLRVQDIISNSAIASQATIHKELGLLIKEGYVVLKTSKHDRRIKYVTLTNRGNKLFDQLNNFGMPVCRLTQKNKLSSNQNIALLHLFPPNKWE